MDLVIAGEAADRRLRKFEDRNSLGDREMSRLCLAHPAKKRRRALPETNNHPFMRLHRYFRTLFGFHRNLTFSRRISVKI